MKVDTFYFHIFMSLFICQSACKSRESISQTLAVKENKSQSSEPSTSKGRDSAKPPQAYPGCVLDLMAPKDECHKGDPFVCSAEWYIVECTNQVRRTRGLKSLSFDRRLSFVARDWSQRMGSVTFQSDKDSNSISGEVSHRGFPAKRIEVYQKEFGPLEPGSLLLENCLNLPKDISDARALAQQMVQAWWHSPQHREGMLHTEPRTLGAGVFRQANGSGNKVWWWGTQIFSISH